MFGAEPNPHGRACDTLDVRRGLPQFDIEATDPVPHASDALRLKSIFGGTCRIKDLRTHGQTRGLYKRGSHRWE